MSGGYFDYAQHCMEDIATEIEEIINKNNNTEKDMFGCRYSPPIIERFEEAAHTMRRAQEMAQRVDYLMSGDDGEETFMSRWDKEVRK